MKLLKYSPKRSLRSKVHHRTSPKVLSSSHVKECLCHRLTCADLFCSFFSWSVTLPKVSRFKPSELSLVSTPLVAGMLVSFSLVLFCRYQHPSAPCLNDEVMVERAYCIALQFRRLPGTSTAAKQRWPKSSLRHLADSLNP